MRKKPPDIKSPVHIGQTFNTCPICGKDWETTPGIPGVIHRTKLCEHCAFWHDSEPDKNERR